jgi:multicomponent K+:H+ antiporter subunit D
MFYLPHTTFAAAALMLVAGLLAQARGGWLADRFELGARPARATLLGSLFVVTALASAGLPPFSGFVAKAILLDSVLGTAAAAAIWCVVLGASLAWLIALSRAGSLLFWKPAGVAGGPPAASRREPSGPVQQGAAGDAATLPGSLAAIALLVAAGLTIVALANPLSAHFARAGAQLAAPVPYREAVLAQQPVRLATATEGDAR